MADGDLSNALDISEPDTIRQLREQGSATEAQIAQPLGATIDLDAVTWSVTRRRHLH